MTRCSIVFLRPEGRGADRDRLRVLRGGAWNNNRRNVRCAYRNINNPHNRNNNVGFRVVLVGAACLSSGLRLRGLRLPG